MEPPDPWPLRHLVLRTPRLELRPDDDEGVLGLVTEAYRGVHPKDEMPFAVPWTDADPADLGRNMFQYFWSVRAQLTPTDWRINFVVRADGAVVGTQGLSGQQFAVTREVSTGSWLGMRHHRNGYGTEMRAAVLAFAFDHLGARVARSSAHDGNAASLGVSRRLGYREDGTETAVRRGAVTTEVRFVVEPETFVRPGWTLRVDGLEGCRSLLGISRG